MSDLQDKTDFRTWALNRPHAARLLDRIIFRCRVDRAKAPNSTVRWSAHSIKWWARERGLTLITCKRAFAELAAKGLIHRERHFFAGKACSFVRPTALALKLTGNAPKHEPAHEPTDEPIHEPTNTSIPSKNDENEKLGVAEPAVPNATVDSPSLENSGKEPGEKKKSATPAKPLIAETQNPADATRPAHLAAIWRATIAEVYGYTVPDLTLKERGQLRCFLDKCPIGKAGIVLDRVLRDWTDFVAHAKSDAGAWDVPTQPSIGFLLRFVGVAVNFALPPKPKPAGVKPHSAPAAPVSAHATKPKPADKATTAEVLSILG